MEKFESFKNRLLKQRGLNQAYNDLGPEFEVVQMIIKQRIKAGLTQTQLAKKLGTKQSAISRLEQGSANPSLALLVKLSKALNAKLKISIS